MNEKNDFIVTVVLLMLIFIGIVSLHNNSIKRFNSYLEDRISTQKPLIKTDTIIKERVDTLLVNNPIPVKEKYVYTITDTVYSVDSVKTPIKLDISHKTYEGEQLSTGGNKIRYRAIIGGYKPTLDTLELYANRNDTTIVKEIVKYKTKHFHIGPSIGLGYGMFNKKPDVFVGVTFSYSF